ncbi:phage major capsid protein [Burkholderia ubonensis]|uniref:phage major capsid protein n=1 Tax=Burkholderia ubonensis TaxID=101571 RepID=UPI001E284906|nr:phage major capsid protein [Burkholderia ubonensis]
MTRSRVDSRGCLRVALSFSVDGDCMAIAIQALRERRDALAKNLNALLENNPGDKWGAEQQKAYDEGLAEMDRVSAEIKRHEGLMNRLAEEALAGNPEGLINAHVKTPGAHEGESRAIRTFLRRGVLALTDEDRARMLARQTPDIQNAMSTSDPAAGGYTVAPEFYRRLSEALKAFGGLRQIATILPTGTGAAMTFPGTDATTEEGEIVNENEETSDSDTKFIAKSLDAFRYSSKSIALSMELLQDSMFDLEGYIIRLLSTRIGRITARHHAKGTGNKQPVGMLTAVRTGVTVASPNLIGYDDLVDLEHSIDPAYRVRPSCGYAMHDQMLKVVRKIKDEQKRPIFVPGYEQGNPGGAPDRLLGRPVTIVQEYDVPEAGAKPLTFGDHSEYVVREVMDLTMFRMTDSRYTLKGQVGFVGFNRQGGNLMDVGGAVKALQMGQAAAGG